MRRRSEPSFGVYLSLILLCLSLAFAPGCDIKVSVPPGGACGVGGGDYNFYYVEYPPRTYNCNDTGGFSIYLQPVVDSSFAGFNRLWFQLEKDGQVYRSNYVEFCSEDTATQMLEWGGSLPTGGYEMRGYMANIQLESYCEDSVYWTYDRRIGYISITEFANPQKEMQIEYFCQDSDTGIIDRYDVFLSPNTEEYMDIAFNIANTRYDVDTYDINLDPALVLHTVQGVAEYIFAHKEWGDEMFLCGVKGLKDEQGEYLDSILGTTHFMENFVPTCYTGSLVAVKACIDFAALQYKFDYKDLVTAAVIHELGHQRAIAPGHQPGIGPKFCIMNEASIINPPHPYDAITFANPHFCAECINKIKNADW